MPYSRLVLTLTIASISLSANASLAQPHVHVLEADRGMVVCDTAVASRIGRDVMERGGNAVDAAVATAFALAVTWPEAGNIGGGGFMMIRPADGEDPVCIDYREKAPLAAKVDTFHDDTGRYNRKIVGVPGTVHGLALAHQRYGKLPWRDVVLPAARVAAEGFSVDGFLAASTNHVLEKTNGQPLFAELHRVYGKPDKSEWRPGDVMVLPDLAKTLEAIAADGPAGFYQGRVAKLFVEEMRRGTGLISQADLDAYEAKVRKPIVGTFNGYEVIGAPPPSSGGTCLIEALNIIEAVKLPKRDRYAPRTLHLIAEASRRAFLDRARYLGDPDFVEIPKHLTSKAHARELASAINRDRASDSAALAPEIKLAPESSDTTHFSVIDTDGMAVSNTYTLEASWGSRIVVKGAGFVLNNEMGDFNWIRGVTNRKGRIGTPANLIAPGKRMLSSQCPVIVTKENRVALVTGSPGGRTIINTVLNIVLNVTHFEMPASEAVRAPRNHHQWMPDRFELEDKDDPPHAATVVLLEKMGHTVVNRSSQGSAHSIWVDRKRGLLVGVADYRRGGRPASITTRRIALWEFSGRQGTPLKSLVAEGPLKKSWLGDIANSSLDGLDHFRITRDAPQQPFDSYLPLGEFGAEPLTATIKLDGVSLRGASKNEQIRLGFTHDTGKPRVTARLIVERTANNFIAVRGEAFGGGIPIDSKILARSNDLPEPITIKLDVDTTQDRYRISVRRGSSLQDEVIGMGKVAADRTASYLRLSAVNDFSARGEYVNIDRIEVQKAVSSER